MPHTRFSVFAHAGSLELDVYMYWMKAEQTVNRHGGSDFTRLAALERLEAQPLQSIETSHTSSYLGGIPWPLVDQWSSLRKAGH